MGGPVIEIIGMIVAFFGLIVALAAGSVRLEDWVPERKLRRQVNLDHEVALLMDQEFERHISQLVPPRRCPLCKKFARNVKFAGAVIVECKQHGPLFEVLTETGPIPVLVTTANDLIEEAPETSGFAVKHPSEEVDDGALAS